MEPYKFVELKPDDPKIVGFRKRVIVEDMNIDFNELSRFTSRDEVFRKFKSHPEIEEIYKFSHLKWSPTAFDSIYGIEVNKEIVSISGKKIYSNQFVRLGMHYYTLKKFRKPIRSVMWRKNGFVDQGMQESPYNHFFITIYAHNSKLQAWSKKLVTRNNFGQMSVGNKDIIDSLNKFKPICQIRFNNVQQLLLHHSPSNANLPAHFFSAIGATA